MWPAHAQVSHLLSLGTSYPWQGRSFLGQQVPRHQSTRKHKKYKPWLIHECISNMSVKGRKEYQKWKRDSVWRDSGWNFPELVIIMNLQYNISQKRGGGKKSTPRYVAVTQNQRDKRRQWRAVREQCAVRREIKMTISLELYSQQDCHSRTRIWSWFQARRSKHISTISHWMQL